MIGRKSSGANTVKLEQWEIAGEPSPPLFLCLRHSQMRALDYWCYLKD